jgi:hypothetical protein
MLSGAADGRVLDVQFTEDSLNMESVPKNVPRIFSISLA